MRRPHRTAPCELNAFVSTCGELNAFVNSDGHFAQIIDPKNISTTKRPSQLVERGRLLKEQTEIEVRF